MSDNPIHANPLPRRAFLKGLGALVALPTFESLLPASLPAAAENVPVPARLAFFYVPNGVNVAHWTPEKVGAQFEFPATLKPLEKIRSDVLVLSGLTADKARPNGDGAGDHARAAAAFLTGAQPRKTHGADIRVGLSVDQAAAEKVGRLTRFPSLELGCDPGMNSGNCDSGYSCAYSANISWRSESTPMAKETSPRLLFERLFGSQGEGEAAVAQWRRRQDRKSVLDFVREDARKLGQRLGEGDQRKLDEYLTGVREIETRLDRAEKDSASKAHPSGLTPPAAGIPQDYAEHIRLMTDLLVLAFQSDLTRIATFMMANEGSNRSYGFIGVKDGHHDLSHHGRDNGKLEKIQKINAFHLELFARFLEKLKSIPEGDGTLLDRSMIVYGSGLGDGNAHNHDELPILLAGGGGGTIATGRHVRYPRNTPLNNLFLSLLDRMDAGREQLGDSTGRLPQLYGAERTF